MCRCLHCAPACIKACRDVHACVPLAGLLEILQAVVLGLVRCNHGKRVGMRALHCLLATLARLLKEPFHALCTAGAIGDEVDQIAILIQGQRCHAADRGVYRI